MYIYIYIYIHTYIYICIYDLEKRIYPYDTFSVPLLLIRYFRLYFCLKKKKKKNEVNIAYIFRAIKFTLSYPRSWKIVYFSKKKKKNKIKEKRKK